MTETSVPIVTGNKRRRYRAEATIRSPLRYPSMILAASEENALPLVPMHEALKQSPERLNSSPRKGGILVTEQQQQQETSTQTRITPAHTDTPGSTADLLPPHPTPIQIVLYPSIRDQCCWSPCATPLISMTSTSSESSPIEAS